MNVPFLVPDGFQGTSRVLSHSRGDTRGAKSAESLLVKRTVIRIARIERYTHATAGNLVGGIGRRDHDQHGVEISLVENVDMNPLGKIAAVAEVPPRGIVLGFRGRSLTVLKAKPG